MRQAVVAIVTGASFPGGRLLARGLAAWDWSIVVVYLEHQRTVEATVVEILAADGQAVAVRADLADDLDVRRLFAESRSVFGDVDVVAHTTTGGAPPLYRHAARHVRPGGVIVTLSGADAVEPEIARELRARDITIGAAGQDGMLAFLDAWRRG
jgi:3-oxoacyl-[acyl-carrier protein] reductase